MIISFSGAANNHALANSISNLTVNFLTGAFSGMNPLDVQDSIKTGLYLTFYDPNPAGGMYASDDTVLDADNAEANGC